MIAAYLGASDYLQEREREGQKRKSLDFGAEAKQETELDTHRSELLQKSDVGGMSPSGRAYAPSRRSAHSEIGKW